MELKYEIHKRLQTMARPEHMGVSILFLCQERTPRRGFHLRARRARSGREAAAASEASQPALAWVERVYKKNTTQTKKKTQLDCIAYNIRQAKIPCIKQNKTHIYRLVQELSSLLWWPHQQCHLQNGPEKPAAGPKGPHAGPQSPRGRV